GVLLAPAAPLERLAVQEDGDGLGEAFVPVALFHLVARRREPRDVADVRAMDGTALEERAPSEHTMVGPEGDEIAAEREQLLVDVLPVQPRDLVVLAVGVVVALLRAADLVTGEQHRDALGEE